MSARYMRLYNGTSISKGSFKFIRSFVETETAISLILPISSVNGVSLLSIHSEINPGRQSVSEQLECVEKNVDALEGIVGTIFSQPALAVPSSIFPGLFHRPAM